MKECLLFPQDDWKLLHFFGRSGTGKTTLLRHFERVTKDAPVIYIEGRFGFDSPKSFLRQLGDQLWKKLLIETPVSDAEVMNLLNRIAETSGRMVLLFDDLDQWITIEEWLQQEWLPSLSVKVRICSTGTIPLGNIRPPLLDELIMNEPLLPFASSIEWSEDSESIEYLAAASVLKYFDHMLLENILERPVPPEQFEELCRSPYISWAGELGWSVMDDIRRSLRTRCRKQSPDQYFRYKQRAEAALHHRLLQLTTDQFQWFEYELAWRKFSLLDNDFLQGVLFYGNDEGFSCRTAHASELSVLEQMLSYNVDTLLPYKLDEVEMHKYVGEIWDVDPKSVYVVHRNERLAGLYFLIPLNHEMRRVLAHNPITQSFIELGTTEENDYFVYTVASIPAYDFEVFGYILRKLLYNELAGRRVTFMVPKKEQVEAFGLMGFEHLEWAKHQSDGGQSMYFIQLDLRTPIPFPLLYSTRERPQSLRGPIVAKAKELFNPDHLERDLKTWETLVKHLLEKYKDIQSTEVKEWILATYRRLKSGSRMEQAQAQILQHRYLQKKGSHEAVASLLSLPIATYYRYLRRLIVMVAQSLRKQFYHEEHEIQFSEQTPP